MCNKKQEPVWSFLKKLKMELLFDPAIPLLGIYPENPKIPIKKNICTPVFTAELFTIVKIWKQLKCPSVVEWIKKWWYPWPGWLSSLGVILQSKRSPVWFPVRAHSCVLSLVPGQGTYERQPINVSLSHRCFSPSLSPCLPFSLKINK